MARTFPPFVLLLTLVLSCVSGTASEPVDRWIGEMMMLGFRGTDLAADHPFRRQLTELGIGGVVPE